MKACFNGFLILAVLLTAILATARADDAKDAAIKKDRQFIAGTWRVVALEIDGNKSADEDARKFTVVNGDDGAWSLRSNDQEMVNGTTTIDPTQKPKTIDITLTSGESKGDKFLAIYELGETTRKLCIAPEGKERPKEFTSPSGSEQILINFERVKGK